MEWTVHRERYAPSLYESILGMWYSHAISDIFALFTTYCYPTSSLYQQIKYRSKDNR